jgi:hypothetical protein
MKRSRTLYDDTDGAAVTVGPARKTGAGGAMTAIGTSLMTSMHAFSAGDIPADRFMSR